MIYLNKPDTFKTNMPSKIIKTKTVNKNTGKIKKTAAKNNAKKATSKDNPVQKNPEDLLREQLKNELERSILVEPTDRDFWLANLKAIPLQSVKNLLNILVNRNVQVDAFVETALAQDKNQEHLTALRKKITDIKKSAYKLEEKGESKSEKKQEEDLLRQLGEIK